MRPARLGRTRLADHLALEEPAVRRIVRALRRAVLMAAPGAAEAVRFRSLCYFDPAAAYGSIGGNICMIEVRRGTVWLSFIQGAELADPHGLLRGSGRAKRRISVATVEAAGGSRLAALVRAAARRRMPARRGAGVRSA